MASQATVQSPSTSTSTVRATDSARLLSPPPPPRSYSQPPRPYQELLSRICDGGIAAGIALMAQFLMAGIQLVLNMNSNVEFPPSVVAMAAIFGLFCACGCIFPGTEEFYQSRLKRPADLLNRHMSIGFTIPFLMICNGSLKDGWVIGPIIGCFVLTGLFNTILSYVLALPLQCLMVRWDSGNWDSADIETGTSATNQQQRRNSKIRAAVESVCESMDTDDFSMAATPPKSLTPEPETTSTQPTSCLVTLKLWALANPMLLLTWTLTVTVGVPLRLCLALDTPLSTLLLFALWLSTLAIQSALKTSPYLRPFFRTLFSGLFNAVLWTSLCMTAYLLLDGHFSSRSLQDMLSTLKTDHPFSSAVLKNLSVPMTAGDVALSILNAGLVSWGLKLYEYRLQLLSRAGLTVFTVSSLLALGNVSCGPLLAHLIGVAPNNRALSFAARSVTLALGNPVLDTLGADKSLNAAMVVVSGILFQMGLGFGIGRFLERHLLINISLGGKQNRQNENDPTTVAAGVTVGINAAAMGTAYLYETKSDAAPYSALSMMALGVMTVVFSTIGPLVRWVLQSVA
ncbi:hypothetical protein QBC40DRAFT_13939 [Triangularia verruculosa]|uniref:LrgB-like protein n=1 Tax=Triangularia verruculosa TaxID=2587418 RepID=A0AAN6X996_9PEZI|nr:hypothetical protein QBC40DRAFT_13939 [Triangularia verruculosa]